MEAKKKVRYVYLNIYLFENKKYYYVGSHTWNGALGKIDPNYKGSSGILNPVNSNFWKKASHGEREVLKGIADKFILVDEIILKENAELLDEHTIIEFFCSLYGCSSHRSNDWSKQFRDGIMLNRHSFSPSRATFRKISENRKKNGTYKGAADHLNTPEMKARKKKHDFHKEALTRVANQKKNGTMNNRRLVVGIYYNKKLIFVGSANACDRFTTKIGRRVSQTWISKNREGFVNGLYIKVFGRKL